MSTVTDSEILGLAGLFVEFENNGMQIAAMAMKIKEDSKGKTSMREAVSVALIAYLKLNFDEDMVFKCRKKRKVSKMVETTLKEIIQEHDVGNDADDEESQS